MKVAIVGCGKISRAHISAIQEIESLEICGVCDQDGYRATKTAGLAKGANSYTDWEALLRQENPDAVHVLTPPATHAQLAIQAMEAGCHVLVEKPMALSVKEAEDMLAAARANNVKLCPNHNYLFKPSIAKARCLVESGVIGQIIYVDSFYGLAAEGGSYLSGGGRSHWASRLPGGSFSNFLPHLIYLQLAFLQGVDAVAGVIATKDDTIGEPTELHVLLEGTGVSGGMTVTMRTKPYAKFVDIYGTKGIIHADLVKEVCTLNKELRLPRMISKVVYSFESSSQLAWGTVTNTMKVLMGRMKNMPGLQELVRNFYISIQEDHTPPVLGEDGRQVAKIMEMIWGKSDKLSFSPVTSQVTRSSEGPKTDVERTIVESGGTFGRVLVTGATGFLGHHVVAALSRCGVDVVAFVRNSDNISPNIIRQAAVIEGDLRNRASIEAAMKDADIVCHCAAITTNQATWTEHQEINIKGTEMVLKEAHKAGVRRLLHISSVIVYGLRRPSNGKFFRESDPYAKNPDKWAHYMRSKIDADRLAFRFWHEAQLPVTVLRLGLLYGPGGGRPPGRGLVQLGKYNLMVGRGHNRLPYTYISNAVDCILLAALDPDAVGQAFNVVDEPQSLMHDVTLLNAQIMNEQQKLVPTPPFLLSVAARLFEARESLRDSEVPPKLSNYVIRSLCRDIQYDTSKTRQQLGWKPEVNLEEGLRRIHKPRI